MIIGVISDTHDHMDNLRKGMEVFTEKNVGHIIHAGDFISPFTYKAFESFKGGLTCIFGNNEGEKVILKKFFGDNLHLQPHIFTLHKRKIVVVHEPDPVDALAESGHFDLIVYGHTHKAEIRRTGKTLILNPGEACGWVTGRATIAIVDLEKMEAEIVGL